MRSLEEIRIIKDFIKETTDFTGVRTYLGHSLDEQIELYLRTKAQDVVDNLENGESVTEYIEHIKETIKGYWDNRSPEDKAVTITTDRMLNIVMWLKEDEFNEYTKQCAFSGAFYLKEDMMELNEGQFVAIGYDNYYAKAIDDNVWYRKSDLVFIPEDNEYVKGRDYLEENYRKAIDDNQWHRIENLTEVQLGGYYCQRGTAWVFSGDYLDRNFIVANDDGEYHERDEVTYIDSTGEYIYDRDFLNEEYSYCEECDEWYRNDEGRWLENYERWVCDGCINDYYSAECAVCHEPIRDEDEHYDEDENGEEIVICDNCYRHGASNREDSNVNPDSIIGGYHCNHGVWEQFKLEDEENPPFYMGFELEVEPRVTSKYNLTNAANAAREGINCILSHDGSLRTNGFEIVSQPQTYNYIMAQYQKYEEAFEKIIKAGYISHNSGNCGLHFHVTAPTENREEAVARLWIIIETFKEQFQALSRRRGDFHWCRFLSQQPYKSLYKIAKVAKDAKESTRYLAINDRNEHTIEIRIFRGTLNIKTFYADLQLVNNLFTLAYDFNTPIEDVTFDMLIQGDMINGYCEENDIHSDARIEDDSRKYIIIEDKLIETAKGIMNVTWREIKRLKDKENKLLAKTTIDGKNSDMQLSTGEILNNMSAYYRQVRAALDTYGNLQEYIKKRDINQISWMLDTYSDRVTMTREMKEEIEKRTEKYRKYVRMLNEA